MKRGKTKFGGLLAIIATLMITVTVAMIFYYLQIKRNESSQNQLHFIELANISTDLDNSFQQLQRVAVQYNSGIESLGNSAAYIQNLINVLEPEILEESKGNTTSDNQSESIKTSINRLVEYKAQLNDELSDIQDRIKTTNQQTLQRSKIRNVQRVLANKTLSEAQEIVSKDITVHFDKSIVNSISCDDLKEPDDFSTHYCQLKDYFLTHFSQEKKLKFDVIDGFVNAATNAITKSKSEKKAELTKANGSIEKQDNGLLSKIFGNKTKQDNATRKIYDLEKDNKALDKKLAWLSYFKFANNKKSNPYKVLYKTWEAYLKIQTEIHTTNNEIDVKQQLIADLEKKSIDITGIINQNSSAIDILNNTQSTANNNQRSASESSDKFTAEQLEDLLSSHGIILSTEEKNSLASSNSIALQKAFLNELKVRTNKSSATARLADLKQTTQGSFSLQQMEVNIEPKQDSCESSFNVTVGKAAFNSQQGFEKMAVQYDNCQLTLKTPLSSMINKPLKKFPLVLLVNEAGEVLLSKHNEQNGDPHLQSLQFTNISQILSRYKKGNVAESSAQKNQGDDFKLTQGTSDFFEVRFAEVDYRIFINPYQFPSKTADENNDELTRHYLIGISKASDISLAKLYLSPSIAVALIALLILVITMIPLLKIRFVSPRYCFPKIDAWVIVVSLVIAVGLSLSVGWNYVIYSQVKSQIDSELEAHFESFKNNFSKEVSEINNFVMALKAEDTSKEPNQERPYFLGDTYDFDSGTPDNNSSYLKTAENIHIATLFSINEKGKVSDKFYALSEALAPQSRPKLGYRNYFKRAVNCNGWLKPNLTEQLNGSITDCNNQFFMERIFNITDARLTTQFSWPVKTATNKNIVISAGTILQTFFHPILPKNTYFSVVDNSSGTVLYHSDDKLSLVENFAVATENIPKFQLLMNNEKLSQSGKFFQAKYKGNHHRFVAGQLHENIPWTLVVFYEKQELQSINMLMTIATILLFVLWVFIVAVVGRISMKFVPWGSLTLYVDKYRHYYGFLAGVIILFCIGYMTLLFFTIDLLLLVSLWLLGIVGIAVFIGRSVIEKRYHNQYKWLCVTLISVLVLAIIMRVFLNDISLMNVYGDNVSWLLPLVIIVLSFYLLSKVRYHAASLYIKEKKQRQNGALHAKRSTIKGYTLYVLSLLLLFGGLPGLTLLNANFVFFSGKLGVLESFHIDEQLRSRKTAQQQYSKATSTNKPFVSLTSYFCLPDWNSQDQLWYFLERTTGDSNEYSHCASNNKFKQGYGEEQLLHTLFGWQSIKLNLPVKLSLMVQQEQSNRHSLHDAEANYQNISLSKMLPISAHVDAVNILKQSAKQGMGKIVLLTLLFVALMYAILRYIFASRFLGLDVIEKVRFKYSSGESKSEITALLDKIKDDKQDKIYGMIIRPRWSEVGQFIETHKDNLLFEGPLDLRSALSPSDGVESVVEDFSLDSDYENGAQKVDTHLSYKQSANNTQSIKKIKNELIKADEAPKTLIIKNLGAIAFDKEFRMQALEIIEYAMTIKQLNVVILADVSPLYRLTHQAAYPRIDQEHFASAKEIIRWSNLFAQFSKYRDWQPSTVINIPLNAGIIDIVDREQSSWPEMENVAEKFHHYHFNQRLSHAEREQFKHALPLSKFLEERPYGLWKKYRLLLNKYWAVEEVISYFSEHAGAIYRYRWELCTKNERVLMYQLATDHIANPLNHEALEHLIRRGYIIDRNFWALKSRSFKFFVLSAESEDTFTEWLAESKESFWRYIRIPIFSLVFILFGIIMYSATEALETIIGLLTAALGVLPLLLRSISLFKGSNSTTTN